MQQHTAILIGYGKMGKLHHKAWLSARSVIPNLDVLVVEPDGERRNDAIKSLYEANISPAGRVFKHLDDALDFQSYAGTSIIADIACKDSAHYPVLKCLRKRVPDIAAILLEKPPTEYLAQAENLRPWLQGIKLVSLNTITQFSPVFDKFRELKRPGGLLEDAKLLSVEGAWMGNYTDDPRPLIGVQGDALHPLGIACDVLGIGHARMISGKGVYGMLNPDAPKPMTIVHELSDSLWIGSETQIPLRLRSSYSGDKKNPDHERRVIGYFENSGMNCAVEFNLDIRKDGKANGEFYDTLHVYRTGRGVEPTEIYSYTGWKTDIDIGFESVDAKQDKISAFVGQSLRAALNPDVPEYRAHLTTFDSAMAIQKAIEAINPANPDLQLAHMSAVENAERLRAARAAEKIFEVVPFGSSLADSCSAYSVARSSVWRWQNSLWLPRPTEPAFSELRA